MGEVVKLWLICCFFAKLNVAPYGVANLTFEIEFEL